MTYGIEIRNEESDELVDVTTGLSYYLKSSGTCSVSNTTNAPTFNVTIPFVGAFTYRVFFPTDYEYFCYNGLTQTREILPHIAKDHVIFNMNYTGIDNLNVEVSSGTFRDYHFPVKVSDNEDDLVFFKIPSIGLIGLGHLWMGFTGTDYDGKSIDEGLAAWCLPEPTSYDGTTGVEYQVISTDLPVATDGDYGMRVYDTDGTTIMFDTTREVASFSDHIYIPQSDVEDVIKNNTTKNYTLRQSVTDAWITAEGSGLSPYRFKRTISTGSTDTLDTLLIKQTTSTNIQVTRSRLTANSVGSGGGTITTENYDDVLFVVADLG